MPKNRYKDWMSQAENDLLWGKDTLKDGYPAQACFIAQQSAEKALKALGFFRGIDMIKSHSVRAIAASLNINSEIQNASKKLDIYYITTRYPDSMPEGAPHENFTGEQAIEALHLAEMIISKVKNEIRE